MDRANGDLPEGAFDSITLGRLVDSVPVEVDQTQQVPWSAEVRKKLELLLCVAVEPIWRRRRSRRRSTEFEEEIASAKCFAEVNSMD